MNKTPTKRFLQGALRSKWEQEKLSEWEKMRRLKWNDFCWIEFVYARLEMDFSLSFLLHKQLFCEADVNVYYVDFVWVSQ